MLTETCGKGVIMGRDEKSKSDYKEVATGIINQAVADKDKYKSILQ